MDSNASSCKCNKTPANPPRPALISSRSRHMETALLALLSSVLVPPKSPPPNSTTFSLETLVGTFFTAPRRSSRSIVTRCPSSHIIIPFSSPLVSFLFLALIVPPPQLFPPLATNMAAPTRVNTFQIKRRAHRVSRMGGDASPWNVFNLVWHKRSQTWDGSAAEAQTGRNPTLDDDDQETVSPVERCQTAPISTTDYPQENGHATTKGPEFESTQSNGDAVAASSADPNPSNGMRKRKTTPTSADKDDEKPKKEHRMFKDVQPKEPFTFANQIQRTLLNSWINVLLIAAPVGIILGAIPNMNDYAIFVVNFIAIIPLAAMLSFATEEIALRTGETLGGLLNASFGNAVELIVAIIALVKGEIIIVQTSLIGSILSNLLLVMGMCFFFGGLRRPEQFFNTTVAQTATSLLALAIASIIIPTVFDAQTDVPASDTAALSRGTSVILLFVYGSYLFFQLKTHQAVFAEESKKVPIQRSKDALEDGAIKKKLVSTGLMHVPGHNADGGSNNERLRSMLDADLSDDEDEAEEPQLSFAVAIATLVGSTVLIAFCAEFLVDSIDYVTTQGGIKQEFLGLVLLPIVGNAAEHATAVTVAIKDKMDLAIGVAVGSSMQIALFVIPLLVIIGWGMGVDTMDLSFDIFQVAVLFVSVLLVNYLIADGKSHWLEGMLLMCLYLIIAVCSWCKSPTQLLLDVEHSTKPNSSLPCTRRRERRMRNCDNHS